MAALKVGVVVGSTRNKRVCPQVTRYVVDVIESAHWSDQLTLTVVDLKDWPLPLSAESAVPAMVSTSDGYEHEHSRKWSKEIAQYGAFIFVAPQYNWGYPAVLKNAIDYLFNEWARKPAMLVTYGSHGGSKCNAQLRQVLSGVDMRVTQKTVMVPFPTRDQILRGTPAEFDFDAICGVREAILSAAQELLLGREVCL